VQSCKPGTTAATPSGEKTESRFTYDILEWNNYFGQNVGIAAHLGKNEQ
jgi:hypothetical protein